MEDGTSEAEGVAMGVLADPVGVDDPDVAGELVLADARGDGVCTEDVGVKEGKGTVTTDVRTLFVETDVNSVLTLVKILLLAKPVAELLEAGVEATGTYVEFPA